MRVRTETVATYSFDLDDVDAYVRFDSPSAQTASVPAEHQMPFAIGDVIQVVQAGAGALTLAAGHRDVTINKAETFVLAKQFAAGSLVKVDANAWDFHGYTTTA